MLNDSVEDGKEYIFALFRRPVSETDYIYYVSSKDSVYPIKELSKIKKSLD